MLCVTCCLILRLKYRYSFARQIMLKTLLIVGLGGGLGSIFRFLTSVLTQRYVQSLFPWATFIVNILGCLVIGLLVGYLTKNNLAHAHLKLLFITGFCGGFTTFSAFALENLKLFQSGHSLMALLYIALSVLLGIFAVWGGMLLVK